MRSIITLVAVGTLWAAGPAAAEKHREPGVDQGSLYSTRSNEDVAACLAQRFGATASGSDPIVISVAQPNDTITYSVQPATKQNGAYTTEVLIRSDYAHRDQFLQALQCARDPRLVAARSQ